MNPINMHEMYAQVASSVPSTTTESNKCFARRCKISPVTRFMCLVSLIYLCMPSYHFSNTSMAHRYDSVYFANVSPKHRASPNIYDSCCFTIVNMDDRYDPECNIRMNFCSMECIIYMTFCDMVTSVDHRGTGLKCKYYQMRSSSCIQFEVITDKRATPHFLMSVTDLMLAPLPNLSCIGIHCPNTGVHYAHVWRLKSCRVNASRKPAVERHIMAAMSSTQHRLGLSVFFNYVYQELICCFHIMHLRWRLILSVFSLAYKTPDSRQSQSTHWSRKGSVHCSYQDVLIRCHPVSRTRSYTQPNAPSQWRRPTIGSRTIYGHDNPNTGGFDFSVAWTEYYNVYNSGSDHFTTLGSSHGIFKQLCFLAPGHDDFSLMILSRPPYALLFNVGQKFVSYLIVCMDIGHTPPTEILHGILKHLCDFLHGLEDLTLILLSRCMYALPRNVGQRCVIYSIVFGQSSPCMNRCVREICGHLCVQYPYVNMLRKNLLYVFVHNPDKVRGSNTMLYLIDSCTSVFRYITQACTISIGQRCLCKITVSMSLDQIYLTYDSYVHEYLFCFCRMCGVYDHSTNGMCVEMEDASCACPAELAIHQKSMVPSEGEKCNHGARAGCRCLCMRVVCSQDATDLWTYTSLLCR